MADAAPEPVAIPYGELEPATLSRVIQSFVLREGTDYGEAHFSLEQKVSHVLAQLERGDAQIYFDPESESIDIRSTPRAASRRG